MFEFYSVFKDIFVCLRVLVEISLDNLNVDNLRQLKVQQQPTNVLEGGSVVITADHLNVSPLKQVIQDVVGQATAKDLDIFFVVKETPVHGALQVIMTAFSVDAKFVRIYVTDALLRWDRVKVGLHGITETFKIIQLHSFGLQGSSKNFSIRSAAAKMHKIFVIQHVTVRAFCDSTYGSCSAAD